MILVYILYSHYFTTNYPQLYAFLIIKKNFRDRKTIHMKTVATAVLLRSQTDYVDKKSAEKTETI